MGFRYGTFGYEAVLPVDKLEKDSGQEAIPLFYLFDTPDNEAEARAESYLAELNKGDLSPLMYESKATLRSEFEDFKQMFFLLGSLLCTIVTLVGVFNFFNAIMTGILARRREFAVLQSVGMTNKQLKTMLIYEGLFYALGAVATAMIISLILNPLAGKLLERLFWFFSANFSLIPVLTATPVFALLGLLIPLIMYGQAAKQSVVERLRDTE